MKLEPQNIELSDIHRQNIMVWLVALRSGDFNQGMGFLKHKIVSVAYCCLGVACELNSIPNKARVSGVYEFKFSQDTSDISSFPDPYWFKEVYGFYLDRALSYDIRTNTLAHLNDNGYTFLEIADIIEAIILNNEPIEIRDL